LIEGIKELSNKVEAQEIILQDLLKK
jgi:hypothetical protein